MEPSMYKITPRLQSAIRKIDERSYNLSELSRETLNDLKLYLSASATRIPLSDIERLSSLYRRVVLGVNLSAINDDDEEEEKKEQKSESAEVPLDAEFGEAHVEDFLKDLPVFDPSTVQSTKSREFKEFLEKNRIKMERREYEEMVKHLPGNKYMRDDDISVGKQIKLVSEEAAMGIEILALMFTGFVVFYYIGSAYSGNQFTGIVSGLVGLVLAMLLETVMLVLRENKKQLYQDIVAKRGLEGLVAVTGAQFGKPITAQDTAPFAFGKAQPAPAPVSASVSASSSASASSTSTKASDDADAESNIDSFVSASLRARKAPKSRKA